MRITIAKNAKCEPAGQSVRIDLNQSEHQNLKHPVENMKLRLVETFLCSNGLPQATLATARRMKFPTFDEIRQKSAVCFTCGLPDRPHCSQRFFYGKLYFF